ncbi:MAG: thiamine phosphate synthase [Planctomycetes bacterium]|nr:thiamine phosphate synthase [Planctomycetota bacterium]
MNAVHRVLDANINRASEGMRVLEDIARFVLENQTLCKSIKQCRHALRTQTPNVTSRDTAGDVGTTVSTPQETERKSLHDVAIAAGNRCAEALRVVEEFLKIASTPNNVESIRYEMYDLASEVVLLLGGATKKQWNLCFVMTKDDCALAWQDTLAQACVSGCDCVQVREKEMETGPLIRHVLEVKKIASKYDAQVIVNDRVDVQLASGICGVHLGQGDMSIEQARKLCGSQCIIGATAHSTEQLNNAIRFGADYVGVGSMFASTTKPDARIASLGLLKNALAYCHLAIGGITTTNAQELYAAGCKGIAVSAAIAHSQTPEKVVTDLLQQKAQFV